MNKSIVCLTILALVVACGSSEPETPESRDITDQLSGDADLGAIVQHLMTAEQEKRITRALSIHFSDMERTTAYAIQSAILKMKERSEPRIGWKIGYSRVISDTIPSDPVFGHIMASGLDESGVTVSPDAYARGAPYVEAEIAFRIGKDLAGPTINREDVVDAILEIAPAIELVSGWVHAAEGKVHTRNHDITGNVTHVGVVPAAKWYQLDEVDFSRVAVRVEIDGITQAEGHANLIMNKDPVEGLVWLANELRKYGHYLQSGDLVITGTVLDPPRLEPGSTARAVFETLGAVEVSAAH